MSSAMKNDQAMLENGWILFDLPDSNPVKNLRDALINRLRSHWFREIERLEDFHLFVSDDEQYLKIQLDLAQFYWDSGIGPDIIRQNVEFFRTFVGLDLHVQRYPYLRIARPNIPSDNVGFHRDTFYGSSPFELSVHLPLTDHGREGSLGVISGSHLSSDEEYPWIQVESQQVKRGSDRHRLGGVYAPKLMQGDVAERIEPIHTKIGQALAFSLALVHGQEVNRSSVTRFSTDVRIVNSLAPVRWKRSVREEYFVPLVTSGVSEQARRYLAANGKTLADWIAEGTVDGPDGATISSPAASGRSS